MVFIIPLIAGLFALGGAGTLIWYYTLPNDKKQQYDQAVISILKQKMQEQGIAVNASDTKESIEAKAKEQGISEKNLKTIVDEAIEEGKNQV
ncbi:MAG: hypothetical protein F6K47_06625 [Symploca sp. SIO2E6]|nr:hypothetical protein [Symploca sp. SIO2E6]